ncbi:DUF305 domain-containing protein [Deinococcus malanensis]|uniref:DUF305 domain-containing protein n=1 Tax=Deinococcus malanensis TaxID=1706855 RepID=A0ABQ2EX69_9DEIO|nr:DUF305 domain-containing protein [Deinococcus malanensis]
MLMLAVIGAALVYGLQLRRPGEASTEVRFVREMIQHHTQAVDLSLRVRERSDDRTVRTLALDILLSQQEQIGQMRGWLTLWGRPWGGPGMSAEHARTMGMATPAEVAALDTLPPAQADRHFLKLMIRHHDGALAMVEPALKGGVRPEVQALARQIQATQAAEIKVMTDLLRARGAQPLPETAGDEAPAGHQH